jgi:hypothetical protein
VNWAQAASLRQRGGLRFKFELKNEY